MLFDNHPPTPVPTIRVPQPYAELVMAGGKQWIFTPMRLKPGRLAIYAPVYQVQGVKMELRQRPAVARLLEVDVEDLPQACLLGLVDVVASCRVPVRTPDSLFWRNLPDQEIDLAPQLAIGMHAAIVANPRRLPGYRYGSLEGDLRLSDPAIFAEIW